jgi:hypothetical protein
MNMQLICYYLLSHPILRIKLDAHCMCAQDQVATHTDSLSEIQSTNVTKYIIIT